MPVFSEHELLENISKTVITNSNQNVQSYHFCGWLDDGTHKLTQASWKTLGTAAKNELHLPTDEEKQVQITSTSDSDGGVSVLVTGYSYGYPWTVISETITLHATTPKITPVSSINNFYRIKSMKIINDLAAVGDIYLSPNGDEISGGVPVSATSYYYSISAGLRKSSILSGFIPAIENGYNNPDYITYSATNESDFPIVIHFQSKFSDSTVWGTEFKFYVKSKSNSQFTWPLNGVESFKPIDYMTQGTDVRVQAFKEANDKVTSVTAALSIKHSTLS